MAYKAIVYAVLIFRIFTIAACVASVCRLLELDNSTSSNEKLRFWDVVTFRSVLLSTAVVGAAHNILQLPFDIYSGCTQNLVGGGADGDKVVSLILSSAGAGLGLQLKKIIVAILSLLGLVNNVHKDDLYDKDNIAAIILMVGGICMGVVSMLTSMPPIPDFSRLHAHSQ